MQYLVAIKIAYYVGLLSLIVGIISYFKSKDNIVGYLTVYLLLDIGLETFMLFLHDRTVNNIVYYNILYLVSYSMFFWLIYKSLDRKRNKLFLLIGSILYGVTFLVNIFYGSNFILQSTSLANIVGAVILAFCIVLYYFEILFSEKVLYIKRDVFFWFTVGALLYYTGTIPFELMINFNLKAFTAIYYINYSLCIIYYSCFILGFLLHKSRRIH